MSEIQVLTSRARDLSLSVDWWNTTMICSLVFAAVAAVLVVVTTRMALVKSKALAAVQEEVIRTKDAQLTSDLKDKDVKIAEATGMAAQADEKAEGFRRDIATANQRAAEANRIAEQEHLARVRIEEKLAGWKLNAGAQERVIKKIQEYPKMPFDLGAAPTEVNFMETMDSMLLAAGWERRLPKSNSDVSILLNRKARINYVSGFYLEISESAVTDFGPAMKTLADALKEEGIPVQAQADRTNSDPNAIHIVVGTK